jgi:hypothetical protein
MKKTTKETGGATRGKNVRAANRKETAMADETSNNADFIGRVVGDAKNPPETRMLTGWFGDSGEEGSRRLYTDAELASYVDIPSDAILYTEPIRDAQPAGAVLVWITRDAAVKQGGSAFSRAARFLQGQVQQDFASGAAASGAAASGAEVEKAGFHCVTQVPCGEVTGFTGKCTNEPQVGGAWPCITAPPNCAEPTGFTGQCTHQPWPNPTRYIGCTIYHCPTHDLTHIPHICNIVATGLPGCGGINPPDKGGDPAVLRAGASEENADKAAAPVTSLPGCGYTKTWGLCETHLLGCGQTKACPTTMPGCGKTNDCPTTMPGCGFSKNPICTDLPGCGFTKNFGACQTQPPKCQPSVQIPCITPSFNPTHCCPDPAAQAQQNFTPATVCTQIGCDQAVGSPASAFNACATIGVVCPTRNFVQCHPTVLFSCPTRLQRQCWPVRSPFCPVIDPGPVFDPGPIFNPARGGLRFGAAAPAQQGGGASQLCATNIACNVTLFCQPSIGCTLDCPDPMQAQGGGGGQQFVVSIACTQTQPPTTIENLCTQTGPQCPTFCGPDCQTPQPNCTHMNCPTDQQECTQQGTFCTLYIGCPGHTQNGCPPTQTPQCPTNVQLDCTLGCTQFGPNCVQITNDPACNINQPQAVGSPRGGVEPSGIIACTQIGINCPSNVQVGAAGPVTVCTQSGPQCPRTHLGQCPSPGIDCTVVICTHVGPLCPPPTRNAGCTHLGQCPSPGIDCTAVFCTHAGPQCPNTYPPHCPQPTPLCPTVAGPACQTHQQPCHTPGFECTMFCTQGNPGCPGTQVAAQCFGPLTAPPQCPQHSGFNCPSAIGCQSIACNQSIACHPQGGGQQQQFGAAAQAAAPLPVNPARLTHYFICPPHTHQIVQCYPSVVDACATRLCTQDFVQCHPSLIDACPTNNPVQCPVASGFNCPSQVGCQSIACNQSIACQPGGGGQQQQFRVGAQSTDFCPTSMGCGGVAHGNAAIGGGYTPWYPTPATRCFIC